MGTKTTIYTLAEELGVSVSAVSRAFNPSTRLKPEKRSLILQTAAKYNFSPNPAAARLSQNQLTIGVVISTRIAAFSQALCAGIQAGVNALASQKVTADIRTLSLAETNSPEVKERLLEILEDFRQKQCDGVIVHGLNSYEVLQKIDQLVDEGIPVVTLHNDLPGSKRLFNSTSNTGVSGALAAELLGRFIPSKRKNVLIFTGRMSNTIHQQLFTAFSSACYREGLTLLQNYDTMDIPDLASRLVKEAFEMHSNIDGIYVSSANSIPICEYVESMGLQGKVTIITSDTFPALNDYIRKGVVAATIYQNPFREGKNAFVNLYLHIAENAEIPVKLMAAPQIVMRSNLEDYE